MINETADGVPVGARTSELLVEGAGRLEPDEHDDEEDAAQVGRRRRQGAEGDNHDLLNEGAARLAQRVADDVDRRLALELRHGKSGTADRQKCCQDAIGWQHAALTTALPGVQARQTDVVQSLTCGPATDAQAEHRSMMPSEGAVKSEHEVQAGGCTNLGLLVQGDVGHLLAGVEQRVLGGLGEHVLRGAHQHRRHQRRQPESRQHRVQRRAEQHQGEEDDACGRKTV